MPVWSEACCSRLEGPGLLAADLQRLIFIRGELRDSCDVGGSASEGEVAEHPVDRVLESWCS